MATGGEADRLDWDDADSSEDSDEDEKICLASPAKSPRKLLGSALKRRRQQSECEEGGSQSDLSDSEVEPGAGPGGGGGGLPTDQDFQFKEPQFRKKQFTFHRFRAEGGTDTSSPPVTVTIPEQLAASYGLYLWPSSPVLGRSRISRDKHEDV